MRSLRLLTAMLLAGGLVVSPALAARHSRHATSHASYSQTQTINPQQNPNLANADALLQNASGVINQMNGDSNLVNLMRSAKGVLIVPNSAGATPELANAGVLLEANNGRWTSPAFFSASSGQAGLRMAMTSSRMPTATGSNHAQPGADANYAPANANAQGAGSGPVAILIMSDRVMKRFLSNGNLSLRKASHFNIVNYANGAQTAPSSDLIVWSGNNAAPVGVTSIRSNPAFDRAVYGTSAMRSVLAGRAPLTNQLATNLSAQMPQVTTTVGMRPATPGTTRAG